MPAMKQLSPKFCERVGEEATTELVEWIEHMDTTHRTELKELNDRTAERIEAKMDGRFAEFEAKVDRRFAESEVRFERRFVEFDKRITDVESKLEKRISDVESKLEKRISDVESKLDKRFAECELKFEKRFSAIETELANVRTDLLKWMFIFWVSTAATTIAARLIR